MLLLYSDKSFIYRPGICSPRRCVESEVLEKWSLKKARPLTAPGSCAGADPGSGSATDPPTDPGSGSGAGVGGGRGRNTGGWAAQGRAPRRRAFGSASVIEYSFG